MRNIFTLGVMAVAFLVVDGNLGVAGDEAKFEKKIQGSWDTEKASERLLTRLVVTKDEKGFWVEIWARRGLKDEMVQKARLHLLRAGIGEKGPVQRGLATWKEGAGEGEATLYATLSFNGGDLVLELSKVYREPKNASWFTPFALKKSASESGVTGKVVDPDGKPVEGATITVSMRDGPNRSFTAASMKSGKDGTFSIGLRGGDYDFVGVAKGALSAQTRPFALRAGQTMDFGNLKMAVVPPTIPEIRDKK